MEKQQDQTTQSPKQNQPPQEQNHDRGASQPQPDKGQSAQNPTNPGGQKPAEHGRENQKQQ